jgi:imidazolonepropionase-like amidohydrolase
LEERFQAVPASATRKYVRWRSIAAYGPAHTPDHDTTLAMTNSTRFSLLLGGLLAMAGCRTPAPAGAPVASAGASDTAEARRVFEANIRAIHQRDRGAYLALYVQTPALARTGPGGLETGFENWSARSDTTWPDTLIARDLRVVPLAPGVVYGAYHYRVTQGGTTSEGISERVIVRQPDGAWKVAVSTAFGLPDGAFPPPIAIVGGTLVNPGADGGVTRTADGVVVVRGGRITCAGTRAACPLPPNAEVVDAAGGFVSPGLIDAHVHFSQTGWVDGRPDALDVRGEHPYDSVVAALRAQPELFGRSYLCSGVTSVYDVGGYQWTTALAGRSVDRLDMPRVVAVGPLLSSIDHWLNLPDIRQFVAMTSDSVVRATVREQKRMGSAAQKVWYLQLPDSLRPRARALLNAAGAEARQQGLPMIVHATQLRTAKEALQAGATVLVHSVETDTVDAGFLALAKGNDATVIPTLTVREGYADVYLGRSPAARYPLRCVDPATRAKLERVLPDARRARGAERVRGGTWDRQRTTMEENLRRMRTAGVRIAMGTDAGNPGTAHGPSVYREMEAMEAAGMPAADVYAAATVAAARAMGIIAEAGTLGTGKRADIVVFDADPSLAAANARRVRLTVRNGAVYAAAEFERW